MSLETIINACKAADEKVQTLYTMIGQHIPERLIPYATSFTQSLVGIWSVGPAGDLLETGPEMIAYPLLVGYALSEMSDAILNITSVFATIRDPSHSNTEGILLPESFAKKLKEVTNIARLPYFVLAAGYLGKLAYDAVTRGIDITYPVYKDPLIIGIAGTVGFLGIATFMYLKDMNKKLLEPQLAEETGAHTIAPILEGKSS